MEVVTKTNSIRACKLIESTIAHLDRGNGRMEGGFSFCAPLVYQTAVTTWGRPPAPAARSAAARLNHTAINRISRGYLYQITFRLGESDST